MLIIKKNAEFVGYVEYHGERFKEWRCPNRKCGMSVAEDYVCCPHCGQRIKFFEPQNALDEFVKIKMKSNNT